jgi:F0F1-type ATP synthase assembly protein I
MDKGKLSTSANLVRLSTLGINFVLTTFGGAGIGWLLNRYLHWGPWVIIVGLLAGVCAGFYLLIGDIRDIPTPPKNSSRP